MSSEGDAVEAFGEQEIIVVHSGTVTAKLRCGLEARLRANKERTAEDCRISRTMQRLGREVLQRPYVQPEWLIVVRCEHLQVVVVLWRNVAITFDLKSLAA